MFHEGVIDGDARLLAELGVHGRGQLGASAQIVDEAGEGWLAACQFGEDGGHAPDKHSGIPNEAPGAQKFLGEFWIRFFAKPDDLVSGQTAGQAGEAGLGAAFDVAISWAGPGGFDADSDEGGLGLGGVKGSGEYGLEAGDVVDQVVGGEDGHDGLWIAGGHPADAEGGGGGGVAFFWFGEDVFGGVRGQGGAHLGFLFSVGEDEDIFARDEAVEAGDCLF